MRQCEKKFIDWRRPCEVHGLRIPDIRARDERRFDSLVDTVFKPLKAVYGPQNGTLDVATRLAIRFYDDLYVDPGIKFGHPKGADASVDEFVEDALISDGRVGRNRLSYLLGDVGVGKSTFVNWLITKRLYEHVVAGRTWFLRLDLEDLKQGEPIDPPELLYFLMHQLDVVLDKHPGLAEGCEHQAGKLRQTIATNGAGGYDTFFHDRAMAFCGLAREIQEKTGRRLVLFLDNIDYVCHWNDRGIYYDDNSTGEVHVLQTVCDFMQLFSRQRELGHLGANIVLVTRNDSYRLLEKTMAISYTSPWFTRFGKAYHLLPPDWNRAIDARCQLLTFLAEMTEEPGTRQHFSRMPEAIQHDLARGTPPVIHHLMGLTNSSLRRVMAFFGQYGWIEGKSQLAGSVRVTESYLVGLMTFMLHRWALYSQFQCRFPNFFLVNRVYKPGAPFSAENQHRHSYWLKLLVAELVASQHFTDVPDIVGVFTDSGKGYEESIVRECLGSLTDSHCSNCISVSRGPHPNHNTRDLIIEGLDLNQRGLHCLKHILSRFIYLQLIVDEPYLPLPNCIRDTEFSFDPMLAGTNYTYVVKDGDEYKLGTAAMVKLKVRRVLFFLMVIEESLALERELYPTVFQELERREVEIPDVADMRAKCLAELAPLNRVIADHVEVQTTLEDVEARRDDVRQDLSGAYHAEPTNQGT